MNILSLNVGKPKTANFNGKEVETGFYKESVSGHTHLAKLNFEGDGQADLKHHGGVDKAVCVYPYEHYSYWEQDLKRELPIAAFGENLTVIGMLEEDVHIGDVFKIGEAVLQISQPRQPCYKIAGRHDVKDLTLRVQNTGYTGFYCRVLEEGMVEPDSTIKRTSVHPEKVSVAFANDIMYHDKNNMDAIKKILSVDALSDSWRTRFVTKLEQLTNNEK
ncbi:MOSC domain-containing protein [Sporosarcina limicola]|uniref:MOSC domain-containing protein YiiM n=1 Tax=Sporosarcina limicola TaxID=34101 RepID=A0A927R5L5_9BACL|nr:MOSC domain-containing protein [Sporosarcina limicola]MBE1554039.1 MOSC domain-containing protein YiiM [Sporosarcina limicola]